jgi:hypothetical protein
LKNAKAIHDHLQELDRKLYELKMDRTSYYYGMWEPTLKELSKKERQLLLEELGEDHDHGDRPDCGL